MSGCGNSAFGEVYDRGNGPLFTRRIVRERGQVRAIRYSLVLVMGLACASTARADLVVAPMAAPTAAVPVAERLALRDSGSDSLFTGGDLASRALATACVPGHQPWANLPVAPASAKGEHAVRELPALPGSASLFLSAMLTVGTWHTIRKAGQLHLADLPAWYHADAPYQIGHSIACDPSLRFELLAVCPFDVPPAAESVRSSDTTRELPSRYDSEHFLTIESPRGPPAIS